MNQRLSLGAAWLVLAFIAFATLSPLQDRPVVAGPQFEHFTAFALMGFAFVRAYPNRLLLIIAVVIGTAFALEALQLLTPDRHGRLLDALVKAGGGLSGIAIGHFAELLLRGPLNRFKAIRPDGAQEPPSALQP
ncbi:VanZ family protein [Bradyrhizobium sp. Leo121]|uniref:VanZ family protein n=1 Tax=Bradyrhizobium sp. Leo121 TaxID=1571195 RepID=UPI001FE101DA|nr:VanZ family protein [Bradyrhizobium sp. Leo121]